MNYYDRKRVSASLIKNLIKHNDFNLAIEENVSSKAMQEGTHIHSYLLESETPSDVHNLRYSVFKPFFDSLGGEREKEFYFDFEGIKCKSKIDLINDEVWDLKTTSQIKNIYDIITDYNYDLQLEFYRIPTKKKANFIFIDKNLRANLQVVRYQNSKKNLETIKDVIFTFKQEILNWQE